MVSEAGFQLKRIGSTLRMRRKQRRVELAYHYKAKARGVTVHPHKLYDLLGTGIIQQF